jgi:hypothetical protein
MPGASVSLTETERPVNGDANGESVAPQWTSSFRLLPAAMTLVLVLVAAVVAAVAVTTWHLPWRAYWQRSSPPLVEAFFQDPAGLPTTYERGVALPFSFEVVNVAGSARDVRWTVRAVDTSSGRSMDLGTGLAHLAPGSEVERHEGVVLLSTSTAEIRVDLSEGPSIDFYVDRVVAQASPHGRAF